MQRCKNKGDSALTFGNGVSCECVPTVVVTCSNAYLVRHILLLDKGGDARDAQFVSYRHPQRLDVGIHSP